MKIAFVGKGGAGKSTIAALFTRFINDHLNQAAFVLDADLNVNMAGLLGTVMTPDRYLASPSNSAALRIYLKGDNQLIRDENSFLPTTPPGIGSNLITSANDESIHPFVIHLQNNPPLNLAAVGTYVAEDIGQTCYHGNLFIAENLLTHTRLPSDEWLIADMVAGTDAFSYTLHTQFDAIILIAEPTPESAEVCRLYLGLAKEAGVDDIIQVLPNKISDPDDLTYIQSTLGNDLVNYIPTMPQLKKARQLGKPITADFLATELLDVMEFIRQKALKTPVDEKRRFERLRQMHKKLCQKYWVKSGYGEDVIRQYS